MLANLLLLMGVAFLPFPTAILAEHLADPAARTQATVFYGATLIFTSLTFNLVWWAGRRHGRLLESAGHERGAANHHPALRVRPDQLRARHRAWRSSTYGSAWVYIWRWLFGTHAPSSSERPAAQPA
jgi:hypothetical protein